MTGTAEARLLFVVSNDYGELSNALALVHGYPFRALVLLPDRLYAVNEGRLPVRAERWTSTDEVVARVATEDPDVVFLFSAYLYAINRLLDLDDVARLVGALRAARRPVVTTDPFLGLLARPDVTTFRDGHPNRAWFAEHFGRLAAVLADVPHLHPVNVEVSGLRTVSCFNPHIVPEPDTIRTTAQRVTGWMDLDPPRPRWVFVLSGEDLVRQTRALGCTALEDLLVAKLAETARARRQPVLLAPPPVLDAIRARTRSIEGIVLLGFVSHSVFTALVLDAEHVFYWNILSNSIPLRVLAHRPVFFFDAGHMVHAIPALAAEGIAGYWAGVSPQYLDLRQPLEPGRLAALAAAQDVAVEPAREAFRRATRPDALVNLLLHEPLVGR